MIDQSIYNRICTLASCLVAALIISACGATDRPPTATPGTAAAPSSITTVSEPPAANLGDGCVETFDASIDYFPDKARIKYAEGWTIDYFNHYKVITVVKPWQGSDVTFQYVLVQCGTPTPDGFDGGQVIEVPADSIVTMSTTYLPHLAELDLLDRLVGLDDMEFVYTPAVVERVESGKLAEIGNGATVNVERVLELNPSLVMTYGIGDPQSDAHPQLLAAGVPVAINAEYMETLPLGRAEWIKFTAAFFNREAAAEAVFADIATRYEDLTGRVDALDARPTVLVNVPFQGTWYMSGGNSFFARLLEDAGATYLWADEETTDSLPLSFESVFERAASADYWLNTGTWSHIDDMLAADERFGAFTALQQGRVYNNNRRLNQYGGNDFWESGVTHPHLVLADLIAILHPEVLPDHELYYYQQVQ